MRYYKNRQLEMVRMVTSLLSEQRDKLYAKVPALGEFITELEKRYGALQQLTINNRGKSLVKTLQKKDSRKEFVEVLYNLSGMLRAHHFKMGSKVVRKNESNSLPEPDTAAIPYRRSN